MDPPKKKPRLSQNFEYDTFVPLENGSSPFQNAPQDIIERIFRCLTDDNIKTKMGLEVICSRFRNRIIDRRCWIWNNRLILDYDFNKVIVNGTEFNENTALNAITVFLQRATINEVQFLCGTWPGYFDLNLQEQIIAYRHSFNLQSIQFSEKYFDAILDETCEGFLQGFAECNLSQMKKVSVSSGDISVEFREEFWSFVLDCPNLTTLSLNVFETNSIGIHTLKSYLVDYCPNIETLEIMHVIMRDEYESFGALFNNLKKLKSISLGLINPTPLINFFDEDLRSRIETLSLNLVYSLYGSGEILVMVPTLFPNLKKFEPSLFYDLHHSWDTVLSANLIQNIIHNFIGRGPYEFTLSFRVKNKRKLIGLIRGMNCRVFVDRGIVKCVKDDLVVVLDLKSKSEI